MEYLIASEPFSWYSHKTCLDCGREIVTFGSFEEARVGRCPKRRSDRYGRRHNSYQCHDLAPIAESIDAKRWADFSVRCLDEVLARTSACD